MGHNLNCWSNFLIVFYSNKMTVTMYFWKYLQIFSQKIKSSLGEMALCSIGRGVFPTVPPNEPLRKVSVCKSNPCTMTEVSAEI